MCFSRLFKVCCEVCKPRLTSAMLFIAGLCAAPDVTVANIIVADSCTRAPMRGVNVFDRNGKYLGVTGSNGCVYCASKSDYPLSIRCLGYKERRVLSGNSGDTAFMVEHPMELPEVVVETRSKNFLHTLAYVREYSTLATYTDTVTMFREKMVDFMLPCEDKSKFRGWNFPRVLNSRSYFHFTNASGLDSVSARCLNHFTWADWMAMFPSVKMPSELTNVSNGSVTMRGKYSVNESWVRNDDRIAIDIDVLADSFSLRWVPDLNTFYHKEGLDFEELRLRLNYSNVVGSEVSPADLASYSFNIHSRGRGNTMFMFHRPEQPYFVTTYAEVYILDKEYVNRKEARRWESRSFAPDEIEIYEPEEAPELQPETLALIGRVNSLDTDKLRLVLEPDRRLVGRNVRKQNFSLGHRALSLLKDLTGITLFKSRKNFKNNWRDFSKKQINTNRSRRSE